MWQLNDVSMILFHIKTEILATKHLLFVNKISLHLENGWNDWVLMHNLANQCLVNLMQVQQITAKAPGTKLSTHQSDWKGLTTERGRTITIIEWRTTSSASHNAFLRFNLAFNFPTWMFKQQLQWDTNLKMWLCHEKKTLSIFHHLSHLSVQSRTHERNKVCRRDYTTAHP